MLEVIIDAILFSLMVENVVIASKSMSPYS